MSFQLADQSLLFHSLTVAIVGMLMGRDFLQSAEQFAPLPCIAVLGVLFRGQIGLGASQLLAGSVAAVDMCMRFLPAGTLFGIATVTMLMLGLFAGQGAILIITVTAVAMLALSAGEYFGIAAVVMAVLILSAGQKLGLLKAPFFYRVGMFSRSTSTVWI